MKLFGWKKTANVLNKALDREAKKAAAARWRELELMCDNAKLQRRVRELERALEMSRTSLRCALDELDAVKKSNIKDL